MGVPNGWRDDGQTLTAPNGFVVQHGFRAYVLAHAWQDWDWPLMNEAGRPEAELGNPKGPGTFQLFRTRQLVYFQSDGTISESWIGLAVQYLQNEVNDVQAALATANGRVASLAQQLAQAQQQKGGQSTAPAPTSDPVATQALQALKSLDAALAAVRAQGK